MSNIRKSHMRWSLKLQQHKLSTRAQRQMAHFYAHVYHMPWTYAYTFTTTVFRWRFNIVSCFDLTYFHTQFGGKAETWSQNRTINSFLLHNERYWRVCSMIIANQQHIITSFIVIEKSSSYEMLRRKLKLPEADAPSIEKKMKSSKSASTTLHPHSISSCPELGLINVMFLKNFARAKNRANLTWFRECRHGDSCENTWLREICFQIVLSNGTSISSSTIWVEDWQIRRSRALSSFFA